MDTTDRTPATSTASDSARAAEAIGELIAAGFDPAALLAALEARTARAGPALEWVPAPGEPYVVTRSGRLEPVHFDKITARVRALAAAHGDGARALRIDPVEVARRVVSGFVPGSTTAGLDAAAVAACRDLGLLHPDYDSLAARLAVDGLHKRTPAALADALDALAAAAPPGFPPRADPRLAPLARRHAATIAAAYRPERELAAGYFGAATVARTYLLRAGAPVDDPLGDRATPLERPGHMHMRAALGVHALGAIPPREDAAVASAMRLYDALSRREVSLATPTLINAGTLTPQLSSCFQVAIADDLRSIFAGVGEIAAVSKLGGGVSLWAHALRARGAPIRSSGGLADGVAPVLRLVDCTIDYVDQGGRRRGAAAVYLAADHADVFEFLAAGGPRSSSKYASPHLKLALFIPDLFMETLEAELAMAAWEAGGRTEPPPPAPAPWRLFDPSTLPTPLHLLSGDAYREAVAQGLAVSETTARAVLEAALARWADSGTPYIIFKDAVQRKSNLAHVAPICSSNLCAEILIPSWSAADAATFARFHPDNAAGGETGVCNLAAINLVQFIPVDGTPRYNFAGVIRAAGVAADALDAVVDRNLYPTEECRRSNQRHRPIGVGIMGLADVLAALEIAYDSRAARTFARAAAAAVYYGATDASARAAAARARPGSPLAGAFASFGGSPSAAGRLTPDLWAEEAAAGPRRRAAGCPSPAEWDEPALPADWEEVVAQSTDGALTPAMWADLRARIRATGLRNSYLTAYMPTATTAAAVGVNESFEPFTTNFYTRKTAAGEFAMVNPWLVSALGAAWTPAAADALALAGGSAAALAAAPPAVQRRFRTARELAPHAPLEIAAAMAPFVCQSLSLNLWLARADLPKIIAFLLRGWRRGLKTGLYYCHTSPAGGTQRSFAAQADPAPADPAPSWPADQEAAEACRRDNPGACMSCSV